MAIASLTESPLLEKIDGGFLTSAGFSQQNTKFTAIPNQARLVCKF
jgi:hypothetical protein